MCLLQVGDWKVHSKEAVEKLLFKKFLFSGSHLQTWPHIVGEPAPGEPGQTFFQCHNEMSVINVTIVKTVTCQGLFHGAG